ncbi:hypothetical protein B9Z65_8889 [Elsinoe australis]|uniref:Uncharacterized protein n=1 Tax=Elsinoe australis TaxID=40998 RepID=A0A2P7YF26_9PEZI|nr:hypothetical protein B9Z65_8889 [Elsinoe australis]
MDMSAQILPALTNVSLATVLHIQLDELPNGIPTPAVPSKQVTVSAPAANGPFAFLQLPAEIRNGIYQHVVNKWGHPEDSAEPAISRACRQTSLESAKMFYHDTTVALHFSFLPFILSQPYFINLAAVNQVLQRPASTTAPRNMEAIADPNSPFLPHVFPDSRLPDHPILDGPGFLAGLKANDAPLPTRIQFPVAYASGRITPSMLRDGVDRYDASISRLVLTVIYNHATGTLRLERIEEICEVFQHSDSTYKQHRYTLIQRDNTPKDSMPFFKQATSKPAHATRLARNVHNFFLPAVNMANEAAPKEEWAVLKDGEVRRLEWMIRLIGSLQMSMYYEEEMRFHCRTLLGLVLPFGYWFP